MRKVLFCVMGCGFCVESSATTETMVVVDNAMVNQLCFSYTQIIKILKQRITLIKSGNFSLEGLVLEKEKAKAEELLHALEFRNGPDKKVSQLDFYGNNKGWQSFKERLDALEACAAEQGAGSSTIDVSALSEAWQQWKDVCYEGARCCLVENADEMRELAKVSKRLQKVASVLDEKEGSTAEFTSIISDINRSIVEFKVHGSGQ